MSIAFLTACNNWYRTEKDANKAKKHFNNTFIDTSKIAIEMAKPVVITVHYHYLRMSQIGYSGWRWRASSTMEQIFRGKLGLRAYHQKGRC